MPLEITMTINDYANNKSPLAGGAVYVWHCDRRQILPLLPGRNRENYLRGVQETDDRGQVRFTTIFPACSSGRWPHIHFEVYPEPGQGNRQREQDRHIADGPTRGHLSGGLRDQRIRTEPQQHEPRQPGH